MLAEAVNHQRGPVHVRNKQEHKVRPQKPAFRLWSVYGAKSGQNVSAACHNETGSQTYTPNHCGAFASTAPNISGTNITVNMGYSIFVTYARIILVYRPSATPHQLTA